MPNLPLRSPLLALAAASAWAPLARPAHAAPPEMFATPTSTWRLSAGDSLSSPTLPSASTPSFGGLSEGSGDISSARSGSSHNSSLDRAARFASGTGNLLFLGAGTLLPLLEDGSHGKQHTFRTADSVLTSTLITEGLKHIVREKRPDGSSRTSFPSGHATAAFAVATMQSYYHPHQAPFWYLGATLIAASRVQLDRHYVHDVVAGAAVGYFTSRLELRQKRGLLLRPFISESDSGARAQAGGGGLSISGTF